MAVTPYTYHCDLHKHNVAVVVDALEQYIDFIITVKQLTDTFNFEQIKNPKFTLAHITNTLVQEMLIHRYTRAGWNRIRFNVLDAGHNILNVTGKMTMHMFELVDFDGNTTQVLLGSFIDDVNLEDIKNTVVQNDECNCPTQSVMAYKQ